jgi:hypothetical protein
MDAFADSVINPINFASFFFREYFNTSFGSAGYIGVPASNITGLWRRSLSPSANTPERTPEKVDPLPAFQAYERSLENEADGEAPIETCLDPADNDPNLIAGPAKLPEADEKRVVAVDDTIAASKLDRAEDFSKKVYEAETSKGMEEECSKNVGIVATEKPKAFGAGEEPSMSAEDEDTP